MSSGSTGRRSVFRRKPVDAFVTETRPDAEGGELSRSIGLFQLTMFGVGATIGTGIFIVLSRRHAVPLRLTTIVIRNRQMYPSQVGYDAERLVVEQWRAQAREAQEKALATLPNDVSVETDILDGHDWEDALDSLPWEDGEMLVVGSSRLGPVAKVFLGSSATKIIRSSPVPVLVVPRSADVRLQDSAPNARGIEREQ
jgi:nucleotide-binding universal stress UspA family protein